MTGVEYATKVTAANVGVSVGAANAGMAKQFLDDAQVGSVVQQMGCKRMA